MMRIVAPLAVFLIALPLAASAFKEGPYPNVTGGFGEQSCHLCHLDNPVNAPGGGVALEGVPQAFVPGRTADIHDLAADAAGATGGLAAMWLLARLKRSER